MTSSLQVVAAQETAVNANASRITRAKRKKSHSSASSSGSNNGNNSSNSRRRSSTIAFERLRAVLQDMAAAERLQAIAGLPGPIRGTFLLFMERRRREHHTTASGRKLLPLMDAARRSSTAPKKRSWPPQRPQSVEELRARVRTIQHVHCTRYQANVQVKDLRLYTSEQGCRGVAERHQSILQQLQLALHDAAALDASLWESPAAVFEVCSTVLTRNGTTEQQLGLRAWVHLRASRHLGKHARVASATGSLQEVLAVHSRLLRARGVSWEAFRLEWLRILQVHRGMPRSAAIAHVDRQRQAHLRERLANALRPLQMATRQSRRVALIASKTLDTIGGTSRLKRRAPTSPNSAATDDELYTKMPRRGNASSSPLCSESTWSPRSPE